MARKRRDKIGIGVDGTRGATNRYLQIDYAGKEDKMLAKIYGVLTFIFLILATGAAEGGLFILGLLFIGLFWLFARLAWYESGKSRRRRSR